MLPTLTALSGSSDTSVAEVRQRVAAAEGLTPEEVQELLPSGRQPVFTNRVSWAIIHMERSACAPGSGMRSNGSARIISTGKTCKALVVSLLVPQERLWVDDLPASANLG